MEGGGRGNLLDPAAAEFYPALAASQFALAPPQIYYTYPPPPPPLPPPPPVMAVPVFHLQQPQQVEMATPAPPVATNTRAVVLSMVPRHVGEAEVRTDMEAFGGVRAVEMGALTAEGVVTVHFFDLRSAELAVAEVREQHARIHSRIGYGAPGASGGGENWAAPWLWHTPVLGGGGRGTIAGQPVWAQFAASTLDDPNQGSIVVLNSDTSISFIALREIFEPFGAVKEVREMPSRPQHKLVEFFDTRDAARALSELNGKDVNGRRLVLEFTWPVGNHTRRCNYPRRSSGHGHGHHNSPLPPRFLRGGPQPSSRWAQASGASSRSSSSSSARDRGSAEQNQGSPVVLRTNANATATAAVARSGSGSGRRNKSNNSSSSNHPSSSSSSSSSRQQQQQQQQPQQQQSSGGVSSSGSRRGWKNRGKSSGESRFLFKEAESEDSSESSCRDSRTTVMIKNIPNKYSQKLLLNMLDNHCIQCNEQIGEGADEQPYSAYDFVYLPIDFNNKCNVGYGFVNLTSPEAAFRLYKAFHLQPWEVFNSRKICQVTYARLQGLEALKEHFRNSKFACDNDEYMPVVFSPPRDGRELTEPVPVVVGREQYLARTASGCTDEAVSQLAADSGGASSTTTSTHAPSDNADGADDEDDYNDDVEDDEDDEVGNLGGRGNDGGSSSGGDETGMELTAAVLHLSCN
ncbi:hypothetical protein Cni_G03224 [Canna indica]|uniref:RRM domain-containing protein n=1 Tax=Canna indica TaxID=4628 RepID=A0AAQ3JU63_9LILI|nr:hypothetical protein Cni_G03224 [Canna indica]